MLKEFEKMKKELNTATTDCGMKMVEISDLNEKV
jgi:hypothetical protein